MLFFFRGGRVHDAFFLGQNKAETDEKLCGPILMEKEMTHHVLELFPIFGGVCFLAVLIASHPSSLGGGFNFFLFSPLLGEMIQFD